MRSSLRISFNFCMVSEKQILLHQRNLKVKNKFKSRKSNQDKCHRKTQKDHKNQQMSEFIKIL